MIRYFCDLCGREMQDSGAGRNELGRLTATVRGRGCELKVEVIQSKDGVGNNGHFCRYCVLDALGALDDRPLLTP